MRKKSIILDKMIKKIAKNQIFVLIILAVLAISFPILLTIITILA